MRQFIINFLLSTFFGQFLLVAATCAQAADNPFAWDLSYATVFKANNVPDYDTMLKYFNDAYYHTGNSRDMFLPDELFSDIDMAMVKVAILIDYQAFWYMGHRSSVLYVNFGESVSIRTFDSKSNNVRLYEIKPENVNDFSAAILHRNQSPPYGGYAFKVAKGFSFAGYIGVINTYLPDQRNQQLIAIEDIFNKQMEPGELGKLINDIQRKMKPAENKK